MTPLAERAWQSPMSNADRSFLGELLAGAQFFDCTPLAPLIEVRKAVNEEQYDPIGEMLQCQIPARRTWIEWGKWAVAISEGDREKGDRTAYVCAGVGSREDGQIQVITFGLNENGMVFVRPDASDDAQDQRATMGRRLLSTAWFCIEAMQTPGGLCHEVRHNATRQQIRSANHTGIPVHKWIEIRLGRSRKQAPCEPIGETGRTVAWHYRRGHRINHPNPNYPKWRKGGWCGEPAAGIRSHIYVVEVPE